MKQWFLCLAMVCMITLSAGTFVLLRDLDQMIKHTDAAVVDAQKRIDYTSQDLNAILIQVGLVADNVRRASDASTQVSNKTLQILGHADKVLAQAAQSTNDISTHTVQALDAIPPVLKETQTAIATLNTTVGDPDIKKILDNVQLSTAHLAVTTDHLSATADDVHQVADHYKQQILKPVSLLKRIGGYAVTAIKAVLLFK